MRFGDSTSDEEGESSRKSVSKKKNKKPNQQLNLPLPPSLPPLTSGILQASSVAMPPPQASNMVAASQMLQTVALATVTADVQPPQSAGTHMPTTANVAVPMSQTPTATYASSTPWTVTGR